MVGISRHSAYQLYLLAFLERRFGVITSLDPATAAVYIHGKKTLLHKDTIEGAELVLEAWNAALDPHVRSFTE